MQPRSTILFDHIGSLSDTGFVKMRILGTRTNRQARASEYLGISFMFFTNIFMLYTKHFETFIGSIHFAMIAKVLG